MFFNDRRHSSPRPRAFSEAPNERRAHHPDLTKLQGWKSARAEADIPEGEWEKEKQWALHMGLTGADSIEDRSIPTFARGELPHYAGINTFLKAPYAEDVSEVGLYDATVLGAPFDGGTTYRAGTRFGPQGIRKISALYTPYNYEMGIDLREQMSLCDAGDIFTIPANIEKTFDQISRACAHVFSSGSLPIILGGDHSIGYPTVRGIAGCTSKKIGIIHFDRHADIQEKDLDERMHTTPWFHATNLPNVPAKNLVQVGIGGWQVPREAVKVARERETNIITMSDMERMGVDKTAEMALEMAWDGVDMVYVSFDIDSVDCGFVPGTGWPEPGGFLPREALGLVSRVAAEGICGLEVVEVAPPYDTSDITALLGTRVIVDALGSMVAAGKLGAHRRHIDKPVELPRGDYDEARDGKRWTTPAKPAASKKKTTRKKK
ncbi:MAG: agmatinase family protein [Pseudomonadota bacterium]